MAPFLLFGAGFSLTGFGSAGTFGAAVFLAAGVALERGLAFGFVAAAGAVTGAMTGGISVDGDGALFELDEFECRAAGSSTGGLVMSFSDMLKVLGWSWILEAVRSRKLSEEGSGGG